MGMEVGVNGSHGHVIFTCMSEKWIHEVGELVRDRLWGDEYSIWVELNVMNMIEIEGGNLKWEDDEFDMGYELEVGGMEDEYLEGDGRVLRGDDLERETGRVV